MTRAAGTEALIEQAQRLEVEAAARSWKPYSEYRESGAEWLGRVPSHWQGKRLKYAVHLINEKVEDVNGLPYIGLEHIESWTGRRIESESPVSTDGIACRFDKGDVLFGKLRPYLAKAYLAEEPGVCTAEALVLRPQLVRADYLKYYVLTRQLIEVVDGSTYGSKMPRANWQFIGGLECLIPPPTEQRAIAAFLDRKTRQIDELIEKKRRLIELLHEKRTALISQAVTKGLNPDAPMKPSGIEWLGDVPEHWEVKPVGSLADSLVGFPFSSEGFSLEEGTPLVRGDNITTGSLRWGEKARYWPGEPPHPRYFLATRDIVIGMDGSKVGRNYAMVAESDLPLLLVQRVTRLRARPIVQAEFLFHSVATPRFHAHVDTHKTDPAIPHITLKDILSLPVCLPPPDEQSEIVGFVATEGGRLDVLMERAEDVLDRLFEYRQAVISAAVTGKIDVREEAEA